MTYALTFRFDTCLYSIHAVGCKAARTTTQQNYVGEMSGPISRVIEWCHQDESEKAGEPAQANVRVCGCVKQDRERAVT